MKEEILKKLLDYLQNTIAFTQEQLPDIAKQIVSFSIAEYWLYVGVGIIILCLSIIPALCVKYVSNEEGGKFGLVVLAVLLFIVSLIVIGRNGVILCQLYYAPKVFLIEYIKTIL